MDWEAYTSHKRRQKQAILPPFGKGAYCSYNQGKQYRENHKNLEDFQKFREIRSILSYHWRLFALPMLLCENCFKGVPYIYLNPS